MDYIIRNMRPDEYEGLSEHLYDAIYLPEGVEPPPFSIVEQPELRLYYENFGTKPDDYCLCAEVGGKRVGAVWVRVMDDYGHIDNDTPSFAISLKKEYRGHGIGTELMRQMLLLLRDKGYKRASLAVQKENYAVRMYKKVGFEIIDENEEEYIMLCTLL